MSNKNRFKFADDGPGVAVVIRNIIMLNRDEAEALSQLEELLKNLRRGFGILLLEHLEMCTSYAHLCVEIQSNPDWNGSILWSLWIRL